MSFKRVNAVLLPVKGGKSRLGEALKKYQSEKKKTVRILDLDLYAEKNVPDLKEAVANDNWELKVFPTIRDCIAKATKDFPNDKFVIITSNPSIPKFLGVPDKRVGIYVPGTELQEEILKDLGTEEQAAARASRDKFLSSYSKDKIEAFAKFDDLTALVAKRFKLKPVVL